MFTPNGWVFDLDGTVIDTREAVRRAYRMVGVDMPEDAWGRPWHEWCDAIDHARKCAVYPIAVQQCAVALPLYELVRLRNEPIITGASTEAVMALQRHFDLNVQLTEASRQVKAAWLNLFTPGIYVDDDPETRTYIQERTAWQAISPEEATLLLSSVPSSSPLERTRG